MLQFLASIETEANMNTLRSGYMVHGFVLQILTIQAEKPYF